MAAPYKPHNENIFIGICAALSFVLGLLMIAVFPPLGLFLAGGLVVWCFYRAGE